jgi:hypothetical protein
MAGATYTVNVAAVTGFTLLSRVLSRDSAATRCDLHLDISRLGRFRRPGHRVIGDRRNLPKHSLRRAYVYAAIDAQSGVAVGLLCSQRHRADEIHEL